MNGSFYIGYRKQMAPELAGFLRRRVGALVAGVSAVAFVLVMAQQPFANATFEFGVVKTFDGVVGEHPYPTLLLAAPQDDGDRVARSRYHLVAPGKHGAQDLVAGLDGRRVRAQGSLIYRDGQTMLELRPGTVETLPEAAPAADGAQPVGAFTLRGEIVDSKCYLGVMKPGNLKPHKACAIRCLSGGITPVLCVRDAAGTAYYFTLAGADGRPIGREVLSFVAEPIEITGLVERRDDTLILKAEPATFRRL